MTITHGYTTLAIVRNALGIKSGESTAGDSYIETTIEAVSRMIDKFTGRRFYVNESTEARYYSPVSDDECFIDDITTASTVQTDEDADGTFEKTWTAGTDYQLLPYNANLDGKPYTRIETTGYGSYSFSTAKKSLKIVGNFGYCSTANQPKPIGEAAKLQSVRIYKRKDAPFGIIGGGELANPVSIPDLDPDVKMMLYPYMRRV